jgi:hypothetical protein
MFISWSLATGNCHCLLCSVSHIPGTSYTDRSVLRTYIHSFHFSITLCYILFPATLLKPILFHPPSFNLAICFLVYLSILLFPNSYIILFWEFYFLPFSVHVQTNVICVNLLSLL